MAGGAGLRSGMAKGWSPAWALPLALSLALVIAFPRSFVGGGGDDWYYLEAARCAAAHGWCVPATHWAARLPLVLPMGGALALFGSAAWAVALVPLAYAMAGLVLFVANVEHRFGRAQGMAAGAVFALTPIVPLNTLIPLVDLPEFAWTMAALLALQHGLDRRNARLAALAGAALALGVMTRTSLVALFPLLGIGWLFLGAGRRWLALPFAAAFGAVLAAETLFHLLTAGDPLLGWHLAFRHTQIATSELPAGLDVGRSPLFNLELIRHWRRGMGIGLHWTVDPLLNLLADPLSGLTWCGAIALAVARGRDWRRDRWLPGLAAAALLHFLLITYVLAIDPKPRMFLLETAAAATTVGVLGVAAWRSGSRAFVAILLALLVGRALLMGYDQTDMGRVRGVAAAWLAAAPPGSVATDEWTRRTLALVPAARSLPLVEAAPGRDRLYLGREACGGGRVLQAQGFVRRDPAALAWLRSHRVLLAPQAPLRLCLVRPPRHGAGG